MSNVTPLPGHVNLNLDEVENEEAKEPFVVVLGGREISFSDPAELDWQDLLEINDPVQFLRYVVSKEDREYIHKQRIPAFKFAKLMDAFSTYYELDEKLEQARREARRGL